MKKIHFWVGVVGLFIFLATGQYMHLVHNHLVNMSDGPRMLYRSSHIYFLLASIINLSIGIYSPRTNGELAWYKYILSAVAIVAPGILLLGFFLEPGMSDFHRPYTRVAINMLFGVSVLALAALILKKMLSLKERPK